MYGDIHSPVNFRFSQKVVLQLFTTSFVFRILLILTLGWAKRLYLRTYLLFAPNHHLIQDICRKQLLRTLLSSLRNKQAYRTLLQFVKKRKTKISTAKILYFVHKCVYVYLCMCVCECVCICVCMCVCVCVFMRLHELNGWAPQ
jgi:adenylate cyclase